MQDYNDLVGLATIQDLARDGCDVVLSLRNAVRGLKLRYSGSVTFEDVTHIESVDSRNDLTLRELEPGWKVSSLRFEQNVVSLDVFRESMHDMDSVLHTIHCRAVKIRMRPAVLRTLGNVLAGL